MVTGPVVSVALKVFCAQVGVDKKNNARSILFIAILQVLLLGSSRCTYKCLRSEYISQDHQDMVVGGKVDKLM